MVVERVLKEETKEKLICGKLNGLKKLGGRMGKLRMDAWWERCIERRMDRGIDGLVNLKMNGLTAG